MLVGSQEGVFMFSSVVRSFVICCLLAVDLHASIAHSVPFCFTGYQIMPLMALSDEILLSRLFSGVASPLLSFSY
jgi:hypothetical protein